MSHCEIADQYDTPIFVSKYFTYHFVSSIRNYLEGFEIITQILWEIWTNLILYYKLYNARLYYS